MDNRNQLAQIVTMEFDIIVIGGGLNGLVTALTGAQAGFSCAVLDANPQAAATKEFDGRAYALSLSSQKMLAAIGCWSAIAPLAQPLEEIQISDGHAGFGPAPFGMTFERGALPDGPMGYMVEDRFFRPALIDACAQNDRVTLEYGAKVVEITQSDQAVVVSTDDGRTLRAQLIVGADGRGSSVAHLMGILRRTKDYHQNALVCAIAHEKAHQGVAHQFFMPHGPLAILPLKGNKSSIVWSERRDLATQIMEMDDADYLAALRPRFGDFLGDISLAGKRFAYPLTLSVARKQTGTRCALVGDAANGIHPIAGQGLNLGLRDSAALIETIFEARSRGEDWAGKQVLDRFAAWRKPDASRLIAATDTFNSMFSNNSAPLRFLRGIGMAAINVLPSVKQQIIEEAAGLSAGAPKLMRGEHIFYARG